MQNNSVNKELNDVNIFQMEKVIKWILDSYLRLTGFQIHFFRVLKFSERHNKLSMRR